jgi:hypothetical protein
VSSANDNIQHIADRLTALDLKPRRRAFIKRSPDRSEPGIGLGIDASVS